MNEHTHRVDSGYWVLYLFEIEKKRFEPPEQNGLWVPSPQLPLQLPPSLSLIVEKFLSLNLTLPHVDEEDQNAESGDAQGRQEVEGRGAVVQGRGVDDCARDDGTEKGRGVAG